MRRILAWIALAGLSAGNIAFAQAPGSVVRVNVRAPETSQPVAGVLVTLTPARTNELLLDLPDNEADLLAYLQALAASRGLGGSPPSTVITDADGNAVFSSLAPGRYSVLARRADYVGSLQEDITVVANQPSSVSVTVNRAASISGRVRDADGRPLANAVVTASAFITTNNQRVLMQGLQGAITATDASGQFRLTSLRPGDYVIDVATQQGPRVFYPGVLQLEKATAVSVTAGKDLGGIEIAVPR